MEECTNEAHKD